MNGYVIQVNGHSFPLFLRTRPTELSAYTRAVEEAKVYRTRIGAEQWVNERGQERNPFVVLPVSLEKQRSGRLVPVMGA